MRVLAIADSCLDSASFNTINNLLLESQFLALSLMIPFQVELTIVLESLARLHGLQREYYPIEWRNLIEKSIVLKSRYGEYNGLAYINLLEKLAKRAEILLMILPKNERDFPFVREACKKVALGEYGRNKHVLYTLED